MYIFTFNNIQVKKIKTLTKIQTFNAVLNYLCYYIIKELYFMINLIEDKSQIEIIAQDVINNLHDWFEDPTANQNYIESSKNSIFFADIDNEIRGFISLLPTSKYTLEINIMGVKLNHQRKGIGKKLFEYAKNKAKELGYEFIQVKTVKEGVYEEYDLTNKFYQSLGFKELEVLTTLWDESNPCQLYIMSIK